MKQKKFRLIKELPNCNIGDVAVLIQNYFVWETSGTRIYYLLNPTEAKGWWEEIIEKEFEILEFSNMNKDLFILEKGLYYCHEDKKHGFTLNRMLHEDKCLDSRDFVIHKVKCLSTGEVFTVGDSTNMGIIEKFFIMSDTMHVDIVGKYKDCKLNELKKDKATFSTVDDAKKYLIYNSEVLSLNDIDKYLVSNLAKENIIDIIKKKLNIK